MTLALADYSLLPGGVNERYLAPAPEIVAGICLGESHARTRESARIAANRILKGSVGRDKFFLKIIPTPHQVLREHKRINVARARVPRGKPILVARVNEADVEAAKEALKRASDKFPVPCRILVKKDN